MPMNKHKKIIGNIYFGVGIIFLVLIVLSWQNNPETDSLHWSVIASSIIPLLVAGFSLLGNFSWARWVCLPVSALFVFTFPIGTVIGGYYLWYYWKYE